MVENPFTNQMRILLKHLFTPFYRFKHRKNRRLCQEISEQRKTLPLFDYQNLSKPIPYPAFHITHGMSFYGFFRSFTNYAGIKRINSKLGIEHGLYFSLDGKKHQQLITFSDYREKAITATNGKAVKIGPYIHYAAPVLSEAEASRLKTQLGKILLVIPSHSIDAVRAEYDTQALIDCVEKQKPAFDAVVVCLYWKDLELGKQAPYEKMGYRIVTAGNSYDCYFLSRLKSIILLADFVITNNIGTHIGYCTYLQKPVHIFHQPVKYKQGESEEKFKKEISVRSQQEWQGFEKCKEEISRCFSGFEEKVTGEQWQLMNYFFGFDYVRTKEELAKLLS